MGETNTQAGSIGIGDLEYARRQVMHLEADISELTADTGFLPEVKFEEGIREILRVARREAWR